MKLFSKINKIHKMANEDALSITFNTDEDTDTSQLNKLEVATKGSIIIPFVLPLIYVFLYLSFITMYSLESLRGNLK